MEISAMTFFLWQRMFKVRSWVCMRRVCVCVRFSIAGIFIALRGLETDCTNQGCQSKSKAAPGEMEK